VKDIYLIGDGGKSKFHVLHMLLNICLFYATF